MSYPVDNESFQEDIISNNNILDSTTKNPTTNKSLSKKDDNKEKLKNVEDDVISLEDWYYINDTLTREQSEERINISLIFLTIPLSLVLLAFLLKILLVIPTDNLDLLIFTRSEGDYDSFNIMKLNLMYALKIFCHLPSFGWFPCAIYWFFITRRVIFSYGISNCHPKPF